MSPKYKLVYFNFRGRGELIRLLLHAAGVTFEDARVELTAWPALKPKTPEGTLPFMEIDGRVFGETMPLARYIAKKYNLFCKNDLDSLTADIILNYIEDIKTAVGRARNEASLTDAQKAEIQGHVKSVLLPKLLTRMEARLAENKSGYLIGDALSIADIAFYDLGEVFLREAPNVYDTFPKIRDHRKKIATYPRISKYLATRPDTPI
jgi:glutathione S-transferase